MKNDVNDLKKLVFEIMQHGPSAAEVQEGQAGVIHKLYQDAEPVIPEEKAARKYDVIRSKPENIQDTQEIIEESLSLADKEMELIIKALEKHHGKRKNAANELGISERTLYRKLKEYHIEE